MTLNCSASFPFDWLMFNQINEKLLLPPPLPLPNQSCPKRRAIKRADA